MVVLMASSCAMQYQWRVKSPRIRTGSFNKKDAAHTATRLAWALVSRGFTLGQTITALDRCHQIALNSSLLMVHMTFSPYNFYTLSTCKSNEEKKKEVREKVRSDRQNVKSKRVQDGVALGMFICM
ncbi:hypothetical protein RRG08_000143 [Elysia crispata]|uniref:Uncharacterized protein n=1 Tax=Elysia crispata TaxID=231223 RepID=A0AAE0YUS4_9GAST|nr:hypothetical protein RRG08_000143 [Elysia crispata]